MNPGSESPRQTLQKDYVRSLQGILKLLQILLSILTFALSSSSTWGSHGGGWVGFVSISGFFNATIWFILHLFNTVPPVFVNYFIELITYGLLSLCFLIAGIVAASKSYLDGIIAAAAVFAFLSFLAFLLDTLAQGMEMYKHWISRNERKTAVPTQEPV